MATNFSTAMNGTQASWRCFSNPTAAEIIGKTFAYCLIFVIALVGNIFIGIIVYKTKPMRKPINFLILNMAVSDLLFPIFIFPWNVTELYVEFWLISSSLGQALCKLLPFTFHVSGTVSSQSLVLIAVDRFGAVVFPLRSPLISSKLCLFLIVATWIFGMVFHSAILFYLNLVEYPGRMACEVKWNEVFGESLSFRHYVVVMFVIFSFIPFVFIATLYIIIYLKLKSQKSPGEQSANARQQRVKRERNVLKMAIAIVLGFIVSYLPYSIFKILKLFESDIHSCNFQYFSAVASFMVQANCAINPCICFIFSGNYRESLKNILGYSCAGQARNQNTP